MILGPASRIRLNDGVEIPRLGLGVYQAPAGPIARAAVRAALDVGYRLVDTARIYGNEEDVGLAIRESGLPREDVFVTTKLWNSDHGHEAALRACEGSLQRLGLDYVDLYLIHWPVPGRREETWEALVRLRREGKCRSIGVSNYTIQHLEELLDRSGVAPAVNQVEFSPFTYQRELLEFCRRRGIRLEAYSPLTKGQRLGDPRLTSLAVRYRKSPAQILIRWCLQHDLVVIPKSTRPERIRENAAVFDFEIAPQDMAALDAFDERLRTGWDPTGAP